MPHRAIDLDAYFRRIGYGGPTVAIVDTLAILQAHHAERIPFENIDVLVGRPVRLDTASLEAKLVRAGRGGYCFEQNALFMQALQALGFHVTALAARVLWRRPADTVTPRTHMLLRVDLPEGAYLADVGFGGATPTAPLRLDPGSQQRTPLEPFRLANHGTYLELHIFQEDAWSPLYRFSLEPQHPIDLDLGNWYVATHPESFFRNHLLAARVTATGRHGLLDRDYSWRDATGALSENRHIVEPTDLLDVLEDRFELTLTAEDRDAVASRLAALPSA
ncbi:MAG: arylamine N-acetyltransferase [Geminicoccaceae bacterium]